MMSEGRFIHTRYRSGKIELMARNFSWEMPPQGWEVHTAVDDGLRYDWRTAWTLGGYG